jgi:hypothetical protein
MKYAFSIMASKRRGWRLPAIAHAAGILEADSPDAARGKATRISLKSHPTDQGWFCRHVLVWPETDIIDPDAFEVEHKWA